MLYGARLRRKISRGIAGRVSNIKILVACEESQEVCKAFRARGHEAYSCDILPPSGGKPEWHLQCDVREVLDKDWDMVIAHPPCDHLASSGARWFKQKIADGRQQQGIDFFMVFTKLDHVPKVAIENPIGIMSTKYRKPDQIIQPWMFGHPEKKATCLWLKGLPLLKETDNVKDKMDNMLKKEIQRIYYMPQNKNRSKMRSKTYTGIAKAMAEQWG